MKDASNVRKMQQNFLRSLSLMASMIFGDTVYAKIKSTELKISPFLLNVTAARGITLFAIRADNWSLLRLSFKHICFYHTSEFQLETGVDSFKTIS